MLPKVEMPPGSVDAPNTLEFIWTDMNNVPKDGGPRDVWPFDWKLYYECRATFNSNQSNKAVIKSVLDRQDIEDARAQTQLDEELAYRKKRLDKAIARRLDGVTPKELMDQYMLARQRGSAKERKLYAFHGRSS